MKEVIFFLIIIMFTLTKCNFSDHKNDLETSISPINHVISSKVLADSLCNFDNVLKEKINSSYIICVDVRYELGTDSIRILLSQILNRSELNGVYPSYVTFSCETPVFIYTGFEGLVSMPKSFVEMVETLSSENLVNDRVLEEGEITPYTTYTPILNKFSIAK